MLTRLKVSGFKNLVDVEVYFGAFTCIVGRNGVGKSNLFDAIRFLSALTNSSLVEAAHLVRSEQGSRGDIRGLFHKVGNIHDEKMTFEVDMIIPKEGTDRLNQPAAARGTFLRYAIEIGWASNNDRSQSLELLKEELRYVSGKKNDIKDHLVFPHSVDWSESVIEQGNRGGGAPFISTNGGVINLHYDGTSGRPYPRQARTLPRTVLSEVTAAESRTGVLARSEMQTWQLFQLEPAAMRRPDEFSTSPYLGADGANLAAVLYRLWKNNPNVYQQAANMLAELLDDIQTVDIDRDEKRELLTLMAQSKDGTWHPAQSLSDGTLRFLALVVKSLDPESGGVICLEEPENGIHPARIPAMLELLKKIAVDPQMAVDANNPLRQVIINTHSPAVMQQVPEDSLLYADLGEKRDQRGIFKSLRFRSLPGTWRQQKDVENVPPGRVVEYLQPTPPRQPTEPKRVIDNEYVQRELPFYTETN